MKTQPTGSGDRVSEMAVVLDRLAGLYRELAAVAREKVSHMGGANLDALRAGVAREEALMKTVREQEGLRGQLIELIGRGFGMSPQSARRMTATQLLQRADAPRRPELHRRVQGLRQAALELSEANRVARLVAEQVLVHLRQVFAAVGVLGDPGDVYTPHGRVTEVATRRIFETLG